MLSRRESKFILQQIMNIQDYENWIKKYSDDIRELEDMKAHLTEPKSPNGKFSIGEAKGNGVRDWTQELHNYNQKIERLENDKRYFEMLLGRAKYYKEKMLESQYADYMRDYLTATDRRSLEKKYFVSNAYDRMVRIIRNVIRRK